MYTKEELEKYKYFDGADLNFVLDSLTGVISRQYILDFARTLVNNNTPFAMCMMDLDNFKYINDSYGHGAGDFCLKTIGESLKRCMGEDGLVGRFGGDEFILIYLKSNTYEDVHSFLGSLYAQDGAVRRSIYIDKVRVFITATVGSASFPKDAENYNDLFLKMDKALYRGKMKGRNCYIVYVHEKHKDIVVNERGTNSLLSKVQDIKSIIEPSNKDDSIIKTIDYLYSALHPAELFYLDKDNDVISAKTKEKYHFGKNAYFIIDKMIGDKNILPSSNPQDIKERFPDTVFYMDEKRVHAFVAVRVTDKGFIILYENAVTRMWQDYDLVLITFASTVLGYKLNE
jgi:diguanylate cyclase (GGDEF)-like protein